MSSQSFFSSALLAALVVSAAVLPSSLRAQRSAAADRGISAAQTSTVATLAPLATIDTARAAARLVAPAGITKLVHASSLSLAQSRNQGVHIGAGSNLALMGTGGAGVVIGLLVGGSGGTAIALGGGILGLVGFYRYLR